jgi:hypothetical protein
VESRLLDTECQCTPETGTREYGSIFAINLDKFGVHEINYVPIVQNIGASGSDFDADPPLHIDEPVNPVGTVTIDPTQAIDVFVQSYLLSDTITSGGVYMRQQVGVIDAPIDQNGGFGARDWSGSDILGRVLSTIINIDSPTNVDVDVGAFGQLGCCGDTSSVHDITLVAMTMSAKVFEFEDTVPEAFSRSNTIALTVLGILPIVMFFALFTVLTPRIDGEI